MIEVADVRKSYGERVVLDVPKLEIPPGGITALIGPNGAGKSTLLSVIARLLTPDNGSVTIDGLNVATTASSDLARIVSVLRQENRVAVRLTVRELIEFGRFPHSAGKLSEQDHAVVDDSIAAFGLEKFQASRLDRLSGGERQRAFIASVLAQSTDYVLLDEPLNNLDLKQGARTMSQIRRLADEFNKTVIIVLHDVNVAAHHADRVVAMVNGKIAADGPAKQVISNNKIHEIYGVDVPVIDVEGLPVAMHFTRGIQVEN